MKSTDVIGRSAHALLSLPNAVLAPLAGPRPTIDGQRLTPRLQLLANGGKRALAGLSFPPTALERRFDAVGHWLTLAHGDDASWRDLSAGGRRARLFEPMEPTTGLVVFVHGGGWQFGSIDASHGVCAFLSKTTGLKVLSLDYRLAWQAQFPAAFDDVVAGFREAVDRADELGVARDRIAIAGDSAGGNIASAAALALGADPTYRPRLAALIYPVVDGDLDRYESTHLFHAPLDRAIVHRDMRRYAPDDADRLDPRFAVMAASDLSAMPPAYIATAGMDVLRDQGEAFGERLRESGVDASVQRFPNLPHGFLNLLVDPDAERAAAEIGRAIGDRV